jgi:transcriptional regulator with XRE-family HTH domain
MVKRMSLVNIYLDYEKLKKARGLRRVKDVAAMVGITPNMLCNYEAGSHKPPADTLLRLCFLYGIRIEDLMKEQKNLAA